MSSHPLARRGQPLPRRRLQTFVIGLVVLVSTAALVLAFALIGGLRAAKALGTALELLERLGIESHRNDYPGRLSGGERQRVAIARGMTSRRPTTRAPRAPKPKVQRMSRALVASAWTEHRPSSSPTNQDWFTRDTDTGEVRRCPAPARASTSAPASPSKARRRSQR